MQIVSQPSELPLAGRPVFAAIGVFDGVHRGHQAVIAHAVQQAREGNGLALVITFDRHPQSILAPGTAPNLIQPLSRKLACIAALGVDAALVFHFDLAFSRQSAQDFVQSLLQGLGRLGGLSVGTNFFFGHGRAGNVEMLKDFGRRWGFAVHDARPVLHEGQPISSTRVRAAIRAGELQAVAAMLGRPCTVSGPVVRGAGLGRQLGFATANVNVTGLEMPPKGVYAGRVRNAALDRQAVVNWGMRPTVASGAPVPQFEAHLLDWDGDLYGQEVDVELQRFLRPEQRFASLEDLRRQIARDAAQVRGLAGSF